MLRAIAGLCDAPGYGLTPTRLIRFYSLDALLDGNPATYHMLILAELGETTRLAFNQLQQKCLRSPWNRHRHDGILRKFGNFVQVLWQQRRLFLNNDGTVGSLSDMNKVLCDAFEMPDGTSLLTIP